MGKLTNVVLGWLKPDDHHTICLSLVIASSLCFLISLFIGEIGQYNIFVSNNIFSILTTVFTVLAIAYGVVTFMRPLDIIVILMLFATIDLATYFLLGVVASIFWTIVIVISCTIFFGMVVFILADLFAGIAGLVPVAAVIYIGLLAFQSINGIGAILHISFIAAVCLVLAVLVVAYLGTGSQDSRMPYEIILTVILVIFVAWPVLSVTNNINNPIKNRLAMQYDIHSRKGYKVNKNNTLTISDFTNSNGKITIDWYNHLVNNHQNANLSNSTYVGSSDGAAGYYITALDNNELVGHVNSTDLINKPYKGSNKDITVLQCANWTLFMTEKEVLMYKANANGVWEWNSVSKGWKDSIKKASDEEFRRVIMDDLLAQTPKGNYAPSFIDMSALARVAYSQAKGYLLDFDQESSTAIFATKQKNKVTFISYDETGRSEEIASVDANYKGEGVGYYKYGDDIYYVDNTRFCKLNITTKQTTVVFDDNQTIYSINYVVNNSPLMQYLLIEDSSVIQIINGKTVKCPSNDLYKAKDVIALNYCANNLIVVHHSKDYSLFKKVMAYMLNKDIPSKPIGFSYFKLKD